MPAPSHIATNVITARQAVGLSQCDLAATSGLSCETIQDIENGNKTPSLLELLCIADACGVFISTLQGTDTLADEVTMHVCPTSDVSPELKEYCLFALRLSRRLKQLGL